MRYCGHDRGLLRGTKHAGRAPDDAATAEAEPAADGGPKGRRRMPDPRCDRAWTSGGGAPPKDQKDPREYMRLIFGPPGGPDDIDGESLVRGLVHSGRIADEDLVDAIAGQGFDRNTAAEIVKRAREERDTLIPDEQSDTEDLGDWVASQGVDEDTTAQIMKRAREVQAARTAPGPADEPDTGNTSDGNEEIDNGVSRPGGTGVPRNGETMPTRIIERHPASRRCRDPQHKPAGHMVYEPGKHEHTCPRCGEKTTFDVQPQPEM